MASPTVITFSVEGPPPKKDSATSMWRKQRDELIALRRAASRAMAGRPPFTERVELTITLYAYPGADLDNLIGGVCDGLQACDPNTPIDESDWTDLPPEARPRRRIVYVNDRLIDTIHATRTVPPDGRQRYQVTIVGS